MVVYRLYQDFHKSQDLRWAELKDLMQVAQHERKLARE